MTITLNAEQVKALANTFRGEQVDKFNKILDNEQLGVFIKILLQREEDIKIERERQVELSKKLKEESDTKVPPVEKEVVTMPKTTKTTNNRSAEQTYNVYKRYLDAGYKLNPAGVVVNKQGNSTLNDRLTGQKNYILKTEFKALYEQEHPNQD
jgi:tRNA splicing endonuclease